MIDFWTILKGKKTYIALGVGALYIIANHFFGPIPLPGGTNPPDPTHWLTDLASLIPLATIRAAIKPPVE